MIVLVDVDGTLVDTNYHHSLCWFRALSRFGAELPVWTIHHHIGMGGDQIVPALAGDRLEREHGDEVRQLESELYMEMVEQVRPLPGAREFLERMAGAGHELVLSSSAKDEEVDHYLDLLDARPLLAAWTTSADVDSTKPEPDLIGVALEKAGHEAEADAGRAVMVGDTAWDMEAAGRAGVRAVAVLSGGLPEPLLREAGAAAVYESVAEVERLD